MTNRFLPACFLIASLLSACGSSTDEPTIDGAISADASATVDGGTTPDGATIDGAVPDAGTVVDAEITSDGGGCHPFGFGAAAVPLRMVANLPAASGGTIPVGFYDATDAQTTGNLTGSYRSTWQFATATTLNIFEQITIGGGAPATPTPRSFTWSTTGTRIARTNTCGGGTATFDNEYSVRTVGADTFLDVKQATIMFTFKKR